MRREFVVSVEMPEGVTAKRMAKAIGDALVAGDPALLGDAADSISIRAVAIPKPEKKAAPAAKPAKKSKSRRSPAA